MFNIPNTSGFGRSGVMFIGIGVPTINRTQRDSKVFQVKLLLRNKIKKRQ